MPRHRVLFALPVFFSVLVAAPARSQPGFLRAGTEFRVNTYTVDAQRLSAVAVDADGDFVVVWTSYGGEDGSLHGVFGRRFTSSGVGQGAAFQVNLTTTSHQDRPDVAKDADGDFVVVWESFGQDGSEYGVVARRFNSAGVAQASEFLVNTSTAYDQRSAAVAMSASGGFVVVWQGYEGGSYGVFARRFNADGVAQATELRVADATAGVQQRPAIAMTPSGEFVVAWDRLSGDFNVLARRFDSSGVAQGVELVVSAAAGLQVYAAVDVAAGGDFVVAWEGSDGGTFGVFARRFDALGQPSGIEFQVNTYTAFHQEYPAVVMDGSSFIVVWSSYLQDGSSYASFMRSFDLNGVALTPELQISAFTTSAQSNPDLAMDARGDFVVTWESYHLDPQADIFAQRFQTLAVLDIDGDGETAALTDGLLVLRFLFGFTGPTLVSGAFDAVNCTRCDAPAMQTYLGTLI